MNKLLSLGLALGLTAAAATSQAQSVGVGTTTPNASAALGVQSTTQGMLVPRMAASQRTAIASAAAGLLVYQTDAPAGFYYYDGSAWASLSGGGGTTLPSQTGQADRALVTNGSTPRWDGYSIVPMLKADRLALAHPPTGRAVFQTDDYPGLYVKQADGWRCMSGDQPLDVLNVGTDITADGACGLSATLNGTAISLPLVLNATHHTLYILGTFTGTGAQQCRVVALPDPTTCKGRIYRIVVNNAQDTNQQIGGDALYISRPTETPAGFLFRRLIKYNTSGGTTTTQGQNGSGANLVGAGRMTVLQSDGTEWKQLQDDAYDEAQF